MNEDQLFAMNRHLYLRLTGRCHLPDLRGDQVTEPTNATRAARAKSTLEAYCDYYGEVLDESSVQDLLADLHHYLSSTGDKDPRQAMDEMLVSAGNSYDEEVLQYPEEAVKL